MVVCLALMGGDWKSHSTVALDRYSTCHDLREAASVTFGIDPERIAIWLADEVLGPEVNLHDAGVRHGSTLIMEDKTYGDDDWQPPLNPARQDLMEDVSDDALRQMLAAAQETAVVTDGAIAALVQERDALRNELTKQENNAEMLVDVTASGFRLLRTTRALTAELEESQEELRFFEIHSRNFHDIAANMAEHRHMEEQGALAESLMAHRSHLALVNAIAAWPETRAWLDDEKFRHWSDRASKELKDAWLRHHEAELHLAMAALQGMPDHGLNHGQALLEAQGIMVELSRRLRGLKRRRAGKKLSSGQRR